MSIEDILGYCDEIDALTEKIRNEIDTDPGPEPPGDEVVVSDTGDLQPSLTAGGAVALAPDIEFIGSYEFDTPNTSLRGQGGNKIVGQNDPALRVGIGIDGIVIETLEGESNYDSVIRIGKNDTNQVEVDQAPDGIVIHQVHVASHRGKRGIEINAGNVEIIDCDIRDVYSPNKQDSQAIWIGNAPGPVLIEGGYFEAASECFMIGGDAMKIPDCRPTGITVRGATFTKNLAWKDNPDIPVKNIFELKDGHDVLIEDCDLSNCWQSAQDGYAFMFTPTRGGSLRNVVVKNCRVSEVGGIVNITGIDDDAVDPPRTQIEIYGGEYKTNKAVMGGSGRFALIGRGPEWFIVEDAFIRHEGSSFIDISDKAVVDELRIMGCDFNYGEYGIRIGGYNHGDNSQGLVKTMIIEGNTIIGAHAHFKDRWPKNTYV
jgi:hypothetical protein